MPFINISLPICLSAIFGYSSYPGSYLSSFCLVQICRCCQKSSSIFSWTDSIQFIRSKTTLKRIKYIRLARLLCLFEHDLFYLQGRLDTKLGWKRGEGVGRGGVDEKVDLMIGVKEKWDSALKVCHVFLFPHFFEASQY